MQIVIDITEEQFALMKLMARNQHYRGELTVEQAIAHGTPLAEAIADHCRHCKLRKENEDA